MGKRQLMLLISLMLALSVFLAACSGKDDKEDAGKTDGEKTDGKTEETEGDDPAEEEDELTFPLDVSNTDATIDNGTLNFALVSDTPFEGTLNPVFYSGAPDAEVMQFFNENLLATDGDYLITNDGAAQYEVSNENKTIAITIGDNVNWHDGEPVKASDLLYAYELLGHPDYTGNRYTYTIYNVEGMAEYHDR